VWKARSSFPNAEGVRRKDGLARTSAIPVNLSAMAEAVLRDRPRADGREHRSGNP